jgi:hypothetical protein
VRAGALLERRRPPAGTQAVGVLLAAMLFWAGAVWAVYEHGNMNTVDKITGEYSRRRQSYFRASRIFHA